MRVIQDSDDEAEDLEADLQPLKSAAAAAADASAKQATDNNASSGSTGNNYSL
jgi:hypothetical protein